MPGMSRSNVYLGLGCIGFAILALVVWIPLDTDSGILEKIRGRYQIGDALAPTVAAVFVLIGGAILLLFEGRAKGQPTLHISKIVFVARILGVMFVGLTVMRYAGPATVEISNMFRSEPAEYRLLRTTIPWKYIGYVLGGVIMISGVISVVERRLTKRALLTGVIAVICLILIYDVPFEDLQLPPNGDV